MWAIGDVLQIREEGSTKLTERYRNERASKRYYFSAAPKRAFLKINSDILPSLLKQVCINGVEKWNLSPYIVKHSCGIS